MNAFFDLLGRAGCAVAELWSAFAPGTPTLMTIALCGALLAAVLVTPDFDKPRAIKRDIRRLRRGELRP